MIHKVSLSLSLSFLLPFGHIDSIPTLFLMKCIEKCVKTIYWIQNKETVLFHTQFRIDLMGRDLCYLI